MTIANTENVASGVTVEHGKVLSYLGLNPTDPKAQAVVAVAQRYDLDPLLKHVIVIPKGGVYITRDGLLHVAHRSGQLDGIVVDQEPKLSDDGTEWVARVSVYRKDMGHPFTFPGRYPVKGMNRDYAQEMSLKAAEAHALRRAFDVTGLPVVDEQRPEEHEPAAAAAPSGAADRLRAALRPDVTAEQVEPEPEPEPELITSSQTKKMGALMREVGVGDRDTALAYVADVIGRDVASRSELTKVEASQVIESLESDRAAVVEDPQ